MHNDPLETQFLHERIARWRTGDRAAADELLRAASAQLERLARKMLRGYPTVRAWADTTDVVQGACLRLLTALRSVEPGSTREFFALSALQIRRELLLLARRQARRGTAELEQEAPVVDPRLVTPDELELWARFHEGVESLPAEEREVVGLLCYHGWKQTQVAELFGVSERTVRRYWVSAGSRLSALLGGQFPPLDG